MFNRRARNAGAKLEHGRLRPREFETAALGECMGVRLAGDDPRHEQGLDDRRQPIASWLGAVASRIDSDVLAHQIARTRGDLESQNLLGQLAREFGVGLGQRGALRRGLEAAFASRNACG